MVLLAALRLHAFYSSLDDSPMLSGHAGAALVARVLDPP
jgi:hypothetical protein